MAKNISVIPNCFYRVSVKALILDDQKRFLLTWEDKGFWELPGGGLDFGEKSFECLAREIKEEMGLEVTQVNDRPSYFLTVLHRGGQYSICNILYEVKVNNLNFRPSAECVELRFFTKAEAAKENLSINVVEFVKLYNPDNHQPGENSV
ncbi:MAG: NUDIX hydrolase [Patescibacteria group bacterium]|nr:NUDIX hydrolase [Patescibacteria group bacterium]